MCPVCDVLFAMRQASKLCGKMCGPNRQTGATTTLGVNRLRFAPESGRLLCGTAGDPAHPGRAATVPRDEHGAALFTTAWRVRCLHGMFLGVYTPVERCNPTEPR